MIEPDTAFSTIIQLYMYAHQVVIRPCADRCPELGPLIGDLYALISAVYRPRRLAVGRIHLGPANLFALSSGPESVD